MTIRSKTFDRYTIHAGPAAELAALALKYAAGTECRVTVDEAARFEAAAKYLADGCRTAEADSVRFWADAPDGAPFMGNPAMMPDPDPVWAAAEARRQKERDNARARY